MCIRDSCNSCARVGALVDGQHKCGCVLATVRSCCNIQICSACCVCLIVGSPCISITCSHRCDRIGAHVDGQHKCCCVLATVCSCCNIQICSAGCVCLIVGSPCIRVTCCNRCARVGALVDGQHKCGCVLAIVRSCCNIQICSA